ncbi:bifunctional adenosylcobinamide kinase/adenosylcobinamide-phosphate guanylyltransferase [Ramlibacter sp. H39-3-26]|uniref:bifunctional adenosylcobinamide kinase/adenosylcobinamide-phosphate guanylyltransferase n=1 Tax=Curvibacter soli TaxID=3031331 RepID=UPI0023DB168C|nr:bifunctional adenosylcobinamide kinase/adenosylcobinamide-phosphate guanylyltransferase [Ramlibacter sp. H39-3-26]MDF1485329.1 bifunctional adenosylcobinamide kinase/adenosylcobinamide-phosphate guanylyltransferase [Ramlibacter sp. H39-3-26]
MHTELILGGQKSGKSRRAELLARGWLAASPAHRAVLVATARYGDEEMRARIARHQAERAARVPGLLSVEEPLRLAEAIARESRPGTLVVVDCLTLWLTNLLMPLQEYEQNRPPALDLPAQTAMLLEAIRQAPGPLALVSNEIGLGVIPMGRDVRGFVDALGRLNQDVAAACARVTLMAAGLPLALKDAA